MMNQIYSRCFTVGLALSALLTGYVAATPIISDTFSSGVTNDVAITGRTPETSLPGANWIQVTGQNALQARVGDANWGDPAPATIGRTQAASAVSLASSGGYIKPTQLRISADIFPLNVAGAASSGRGVGLGFWSTTGGQFSQNGFTGLMLDTDGNLSLVQDPNATGFYSGGGVTLGSSVAFVGTWNDAVMRTLSYDIDTGTGAISNISLEGSSADYSGISSNLFTDAATLYAGFHVSSSTDVRNGGMDNFSILAIPEPASLSLLVCSGVMLASFRRWKLTR